MISLRSGPATACTRPPSRTESHAARRSCSLGRRSSAAGSTSTLTEDSSSRSIAARCSRSHGTPVNCTAWVISWKTTHSSSSASSASKVRAASRRLGATSSSRGGRSGSSSASSYWPSTLRPMKPTIPPASTPMSTPPADCRGPLPRRSSSGSSVPPMVSRFARAHSLRPTASSGRRRHGGLDAGVRGDVLAGARAIASRSAPPASGGPAPSPPATASATRSARRQSTIRRRAAWPARPARGRYGRPRRASAARGRGERRADRPWP